MCQIIESLKNRIASVIGQSRVAEDPWHSKNTLEWVRRLTRKPSLALQIAALGHDIERAVGDRRVRKEDFSNYNAFKLAHAKNSARILTELMTQCGIKDTSFIDSVRELVERHEFGGTPEADILKDADGLSFFEVNLPLYYMREGWHEALRRSLWGYSRLSPRAKELAESIVRAESPGVKKLIDRTKRLTQMGMFW